MTPLVGWASESSGRINDHRGASYGLHGVNELMQPVQQVSSFDFALEVLEID